MKMYSALVAVAALVGSARLVHAGQTIVSGALPTSTGTAGACYIRNAGPSPVSLQVTVLENFSPGFIAPDFDSCNSESPLAAGRTCVVLINDLPDDVTFQCAATVSGSAKNLRGAAELRFIGRDGALTVLGAEDMR